ncbi:DUF2059 domain-containing protein [Propylenella binzhouense]|nr:DUF2059 domain-containing protein [Propylenella binzhouense]
MKRFVRAAALALAVAMAAPASAQSPAPASAPDAETLAIAHKVVRASGSGRMFDEILPNVAERAKTTFIRSNPQMQLGVIKVVDEVALDLVDRRKDLDDRLAEVWAGFFDKDQLRAVLDFYNSPAGQRFAEIQPQVLGRQLEVADDWAQEIGQEIAKRVTDELNAMVKDETSKLEQPGTTAKPQAQ